MAAASRAGSAKSTSSSVKNGTNGVNGGLRSRSKSSKGIKARRQSPESGSEAAPKQSGVAAFIVDNQISKSAIPVTHIVLRLMPLQSSHCSSCKHSSRSTSCSPRFARHFQNSSNSVTLINPLENTEKAWRIGTWLLSGSSSSPS